MIDDYPIVSIKSVISHCALAADVVSPLTVHPGPGLLPPVVSRLVFALIFCQILQQISYIPNRSLIICRLTYMWNFFQKQ